jgi:8-oxo-dGTP pyrophosphatase MutT (NUDIX family)
MNFYVSVIIMGNEMPTEVVAALIWDKNKFMICQRPATRLGAFVGICGGKVEPGETKNRRSSAGVRRNWPSPSPLVRYSWM